MALSFGSSSSNENLAYLRTPNSRLLWGSGLYQGNREGWVMEFPEGYLETLEEPMPILIFKSGFESP